VPGSRPADAARYFAPRSAYFWDFSEVEPFTQLFLLLIRTRDILDVTLFLAGRELARLRPKLMRCARRRLA
jgi:hypothetical protein